MLKNIKCCETSEILPKELCTGCTNPCMTSALKSLILEERLWTGKPSCTQLIQGTRQAYLTIVKPYTLDIQSNIFRVFGTKTHSKIENTNISQSEIDVELNGITGKIDCVEHNNLWDYKTAGAYKVKQALLDEDIWEWEYQLNFYRIAFEKTYNRTINNMFISAIVRDGGTFMTLKMGIVKNLYKIQVKRLDNNLILDYFESKKNLLLQALETKTLPEKCNVRETWSGKKCEKYCSVYEFCK